MNTLIYIKNSVLVVAVLVLSLMTSFGVAHALTDENDLSETYKSLQARILQLQAQLDKLLVSKADAKLCTNFSYNMRRGSTDSETFGQVSMLQKFLIHAGNFPQGEATGFFGPKTELAVQNWQASRGIATMGTADSTGYGAVGPTTRNSINKDCSNMSIKSVPQTETNSPNVYIRNITNSSNPVVTGTAENVKIIRVEVYAGKNTSTNVLTEADMLYSSDKISDKEIAIIKGRWTDTIEESLENGEYTLDVYFSPKGSSEISHMTELFTVAVE